MIVLLVILPLLLAFLAAMQKKWSYILFVIGAFVNVIVIFSLKGFVPSVHVLGGWKVPFGINLVLDSASFYVLLFVNIVFVLVALFKDVVDRFSTVLLLLLAALNGFVLTGDLFNSFVFLEIITASAVIIAYKGDNSYSAFKYLIISSLAGSFYLLATIFVYTQTGNLNMAAASYFEFSKSAIVAVTTLYIIGLGVESKLFPLNGWVPGVYGGNDLSPLVLSTAVTFSSIYMIGRLFLTVFKGYGMNILYILGLVTIVAGELAALRQKDIMKTLAYSSIAQSGIVISAISFGTDSMVSLGYFHLINDITAKFVLFLVAGFVAFRYSELGGIFRKHKVMGAAFTIASMSLVGFPLFAGFQSKMRLILGSFKVGNYLFPAILLFATVVELAYIVRWNVKLWFEEEQQSEIKGDNLKSTVAILIAAVLLVVFLVPDVYMNPAKSISKALIDSASYVKNVVSSSIMGGM